MNSIVHLWYKNKGFEIKNIGDLVADNMIKKKDVSKAINELATSMEEANIVKQKAINK